MEERVATPIDRVDAPAQIVPVADFMDRLVANDLLKDVGGA